MRRDKAKKGKKAKTSESNKKVNTSTEPDTNSEFSSNNSEKESASKKINLFQNSGKDTSFERTDLFQPSDENLSPKKTDSLQTDKDQNTEKLNSYQITEKDFSPQRTDSYQNSEKDISPERNGSYQISEKDSSQITDSYQNSEREISERTGSYQISENDFSPERIGSYQTSEKDFSPESTDSYQNSEKNLSPKRTGSHLASEKDTYPERVDSYQISDKNLSPERIAFQHTGERGISLERIDLYQNNMDFFPKKNDSYQNNENDSFSEQINSYQVSEIEPLEKLSLTKSLILLDVSNDHSFEINQNLERVGVSKDFDPYLNFYDQTARQKNSDSKEYIPNNSEMNFTSKPSVAEWTYESKNLESNNKDEAEFFITEQNENNAMEVDVKSLSDVAELDDIPEISDIEPSLESNKDSELRHNEVAMKLPSTEQNEDIKETESKSSPVAAELNYSTTLAPPLAPEVFSKFELIDGALILDVKPGIALGSFYLGQTFNAVVANLNYNSMLIPTVDFSHDPKAPFSKDYALHLRNNGLVLYFDSSLQLLKEVVVHDLSRVRISYRGIICSSIEKKLTSARVHQLLGPTYPGHFNKARDQYILDYPGLSFYFHVPAQSTEHQLVQEAPLELPGTSAPACHRICVYIHRPHVSNGVVSPNGSDTSLESGFLSSVLSSCISRAKIIPTVGIYLLSRIRERPKNSVWIRLGITTTQDVMADLGPPGKVFYKDNNKMDIHRIQSNNSNNPASWSSTIPISSPSSSPVSQTPCGSLEERHPVLLPTDYFYNYFDQGVDILFDGYTHCVKKIILHTNIPSHFDFNVYRKCHFEFLTENLNPKDIQKDILNAWPPTTSSITSDSLMSTIKETWGPSIGRPVVYDRSYGQYHNPFHPTTLQGYPGNLILEVLDNEHLASVTLF